MLPNGSQNGRHIGQTAQQQPFVTVTAGDQESVNPGNPNGIKVMTNMIPGKADMMVLMLLAEAQQQVINAIMARKPVSASLVLPDGSPAPLPEEN
jgi:hypothetical protein